MPGGGWAGRQLEGLSPGRPAGTVTRSAVRDCATGSVTFGLEVTETETETETGSPPVGPTPPSSSWPLERNIMMTRREQRWLALPHSEAAGLPEQPCLSSIELHLQSRS